VTDYEAKMLSFMRAEHADVLAEIRSSQKFEGEVADKTVAALDTFAKQYA
jgi:F-type H+-transporting ATPase subunit alpha